MSDIEVGQNPLPEDASSEVANLISLLGERYHFIHGETAAYWSLCAMLAHHLGKGKQ